VANLTTAADLKTYTLKRASEPTDGSSKFDADVYEKLTEVQSKLISGGALGPVFLQPMDWLWARKYPRPTLIIEATFNGAYTNTATFTQGSVTVTLSGSVGANVLTNWRVFTEAEGQRPYIASASGTTITLATKWTADNLVTKRWLAWQSEYDLPTDLVRMASPFYVSGNTYEIPVVDPTQLEQEWPFSVTGSGTPCLAALVTDSKMRFSHFLGSDDNPLPLEYEYIERPAAIAAGVTIIVPYEHRDVLCFGAAYLILYDKSDSKAASELTVWKSQYDALLSEYQRKMHAASPLYGKIITRDQTPTRLLRTASGWPIY
jgi:hypothetical protein